MNSRTTLLRCLIQIIATGLVACQPTITPTLVITEPASATADLVTSTAKPVPSKTKLPTALPTIPNTIIELDGAILPPGFSLIKFADLYRPTAFAFDAQGNLFVTSVDSNIYRLTDSDHDGRFDTQSTFATGYYLPLGITVHALTGEVYLSHQGGITVLSDVDGNGKADAKRSLVSNLPIGLHQNDNLKFGPDGWLYMGLGSTCDACKELDARNASIMRFNVETGASEIYATGMRNPYDLAFHPTTGDLFATDNGRDDQGMNAPAEELNHIIQGGDYGFPNCWDGHDQSGCEASIPAVAYFESHSSANGLDFYQGEKFPTEFRDNAFVSIFGSWLKPQVQTGIQRVILTKESTTYRSSSAWFVQFPEGIMPLPLLFGPDDALYVGDYINNVIYRISYGIP